MITPDQARTILHRMTHSESLLRHARTVELVMAALAEYCGEDRDVWAITGLLHDADYEAYPDQHPNVIVQALREMGEHEIAHAIAGHYTHWNVPRNSMLDKAIVAADELTGFVVAASLIRPTRIEGLTAKSVMKKLHPPKFAAKVDRTEVYQGADMLGWKLDELIAFIIDVLTEYKDELGLSPVATPAPPP